MQHLDLESWVRVYIPDAWRELPRGKMIPLSAYLLKTQSREHQGTWRDTFCHGMDFGASYVLVDDVAQSDFILFPYAWDSEFSDRWGPENKRIEQASRHWKVPVVCHGETGDVLHPAQAALPFVNGVYLSQTLVRSRKPSHALGASYFIPDCRAHYARDPAPLEVSNNPSVGFCGVAAPFQTENNKTRVFDCLRLGLTYLTQFGVDPEALARRFKNNTKHAYRVRLIQQFKKNSVIECDFSLRKVGGLVDNSYTNKKDTDAYNVDFYRNLETNLYNICCRGTENYSVRFYETLCMGRIPIIVDTDMVLPFDDRIDYRKHCVWIDRKDIHRSGEILLEFHKERGPKGLVELQQANRDLWASHLSHRSYYKQLVYSFRETKGMLQ